MRPNKAREKLAAGELVLGTHVSIPSPAVAEICGLAGFDFIIIDLEHVLFNPETFTDIVRAAENSGATPIFRPIKNDPDLMLPYLDAGAMGVWMPGISSAADARMAVEAVKFQPMGNRGLTSERVAYYRLGPPLSQLLEELNRSTIVALSIENQAGIDNVENICAVEGVDVVGIGPADLSAALGYPGQIDHPVVQEAIASIISRISRAGKPPGINCKDPKGVKKYYDLGARYIWTNASSMLGQAARDYLSVARVAGN